jgi:hypothetical protein
MGYLGIPHDWVPASLVLLAGNLVGVYAFEWYVVRDSQRRYLRERLATKGVPICIACGYDLRGQVDPRCPECGKAFDPKLIRPTGDPALSCSPGQPPQSEI